MPVKALSFLIRLYVTVNDIDLREATHEQAVNAIKHATNPVRFVLQSLHSFTPQQVYLLESL
ncbi:hypothetical protein TELCIR_22141 [Teladorsagia circumcincta]|uniref:Uncharacterized protein n=1 Tax=Teladorsagia circumcincta TaxID=45464 RepID=A0A2G9TGI8_TELCI|nr:hypothetical protein TELCIR_22141 [Teladorsagia circumcincta]